ncbi:lipid A deacylase LpxR family protein [Christiangramia sediminis]|uniref:Lipid A deacylase LpxR family protein n=1 Tax=Christiangramia sediminis TaxID=2881336 RepID=A0A9X1LKK4_9FLAO|nr:lipid A deacylase LpxR family protein [Christiangramia sediminis]MCB7482093.1 lipid A deacylase LpxR family protein [Christiangramia sediminis]
MKYNLFSFVLFLLIPSILSAQKIDNLVSFRDIASDSYFRFNYDNDYFSGTDENYTQGYSLELVAPFLEKNPVNYLFLIPENSKVKYGLTIEHIGFTAPNIGSPEIQFGDRPFAAAIMLKSFAITTDTLARSRLTSSLNLGLIGPGAFGKEMQVGIHEITGNTIPQGWRNQIRNDVVINYELAYEKQLFRAGDYVSLQSNSTARVGTLFTNASIGLNTNIGLINSAFSVNNRKSKFQLYGYSQVLGNLIGYDATLQGGVFNKDSPYTIPAEEITRLTGQFNYGFILKTRTLYFEYSRTVLTREFDAGSPTKWGGIKIGFTF